MDRGFPATLPSFARTAAHPAVTRAYLGLAVAILLWATLLPIAKFAINGLPASHFTFVTALLAGVALLAGGVLVPAGVAVPQRPRR